MIVNGKDFQGGEVLLFNKPYKWTSFALVKKIRWLVSKRLEVKKIKVGHAGTLDPLAEGLMIICTGKATKKIEQYMGLEKEYIAELKLGETTPSFDLETEVDERFDTSEIKSEDLNKTASSFIGVQLQEPPVYSAINIKGKRAYDYARKGLEVKMDKRQIEIFDADVISVDIPFVKIKIRCSKGTYIRAFVRDFGLRLNCGAHLTSLKRTKIGDFSLENAYNIEDFKSLLYN